MSPDRHDFVYTFFFKSLIFCYNNSSKIIFKPDPTLMKSVINEVSKDVLDVGVST